MKTPRGADWLKSKRAAPRVGKALWKLSCWTVAASLASACNLDQPGISPPAAQITYPMGVGLVNEGVSADGKPLPKYLVVVNSNFDLRYNAGSVQAYDLDVLMSLIGQRNQEAEDSCFALSTRAAGMPFGDASVPDNTVYPEAGTETSDAGDAGEDASADAGVADAEVADGGTDAGDAGASPDSGMEMDAGADAGELDASLSDAATPTGPITLSGGRPYGSQRGILCDGRDGFFKASDGSQISRQSKCCFKRACSESDPAGCVDLLKVITDVPLEDDTGAPIPASSLLINELFIDSYGQGLTIRDKRIYVPTRSKNRLLYIDIGENGRLDCAGAGSSSSDRCTRGDSENNKDKNPDTNFPATPIAVTSGKLSDLGLTLGGPPASDLSGLNFTPDQTFVATTHEGGQLALFVDPGNGPVMQDMLVGPAQRTTSVTLAAARNVQMDDPSTWDPAAKLLYVTSSITTAMGVERMGVRVRQAVPFGETGPATQPQLEFYNSTPLLLPGLASAYDLRDVVVNADDPRKIAVLIRGSQQSVAFLDLDSTTTIESRTQNALVVGTGPSKLSSAVLTRKNGAKRQVLFASCYSEGSIYVFDMGSQQQLDTVVLGLSGPFTMVVDEVRNLMYVADFGASVVRVVDLQSLVDNSRAPPRIVATLGALTFPERIR
ncbi:MAG: hypothetical protein QM778_07990 [Myxococcales bacterium]